MSVIGPSAVAVIETPHTFVLEGPSELPTAFEHDGKLRLFGGKIDPERDSGPLAALRRELWEEIDLPPDDERLFELLADRDFDIQTRAGTIATRPMILFRTGIASINEIRLKIPEQASIVEIPRTMQSVRVNSPRLTTFTHWALTTSLTTPKE